MAVIVALPFFKTVTSPFCVTVAVLLSLLFQVIVLSAAVEGSTDAVILNFSFTAYGVYLYLSNITFVTLLSVWLPAPVEPPC